MADQTTETRSRVVEGLRQYDGTPVRRHLAFTHGERDDERPMLSVRDTLSAFSVALTPHDVEWLHGQLGTWLRQRDMENLRRERERREVAA